MPTSKNTRQWIWFLPGLVVFVLLVFPLFRWLVVDATWGGNTAQACMNGDVRKSGACWPVVTQNIPLLLGGRYPQEMLWRPALVVALGALSLIVPWGLGAGRLSEPGGQHRRLNPKALWVVLPVCAFPLQLLLLAGFENGATFGLKPVPTELWGGFALTWILAAGSILCSLVPGLALALARQSETRVVASLATAFIELVRGVPLITILFLGHFLFPLFLPSGETSLGEITRATLALTVFVSVYCAEVWRGGLLAVPKGQKEAAKALGLAPLQTLVSVVFPQAARVALPGMVATFVGLFKDTSLVAIVGLFDLLGIARSIPRNPDWLGLDVEPLVFAGVLFAATSFLLGSVGRALESRWRT
jgi:general L-amino acid transport system permease protein